MEKKTYLIFGISKGLGRAITLQLPDPSDVVFGVSRSEPDYLEDNANVYWVPADLSNPVEAANVIKDRIKNTKIDYFIYNVGIWENNAFSDEYDFASSPVEEISCLINTNVTSCILNIQSALDNLKQADNAKIILIGSTWGLDNHNGREVAFSATKFALRGVVHALREQLRPDQIAVSILNLGYLATAPDNENNLGMTTQETNDDLIPLSDVIQALRFIISTSKASCVKEIHMPAMNDRNV